MLRPLYHAFPANAIVRRKKHEASVCRDAQNPTISALISQGKDFGKNLAAKARATGMRAKAAAHVSRNRAAYIAGGLGAAGQAIASRKRRAQDDG